VLKDWSLAADTCKDVDLVGMNKPGSQLVCNFVTIFFIHRKKAVAFSRK
jgi:hypothetical protein